jgi:hypothetical protein
MLSARLASFGLTDMDLDVPIADPATIAGGGLRPEGHSVSVGLRFGLGLRPAGSIISNNFSGSFRQKRTQR